jgi:hypothetical protein
METPYLVQVWPDGPDGKQKYLKYQTVYAGYPKEAAEKLYGGPLCIKQKSNHQLRARVQVTIMGKVSRIPFFER